MYSNFKNVILQNAFIAGQTDTVNRLLEQAMNKECKPFNVYSGDKKADLINIECLQKAAAPADSGVPGSGVQKK